MDKCVTVIPAAQVSAAAGQPHRRLRVAAYCRVSTDEERQLGSFENQVEYYTRLIAANSSYELAGIYCDEGISGCSTRSRKGFRRMIEACEAGQIDLILTKSISRFARNTQDSLNYTRRLKSMGIGVLFEKEGINTVESSGELLLTLFSCFAQEESRSISENTAWGIRSKFQQGIPHLNTEILLGYDKGEDGSLVVNEAQAAIVRRVYRAYLEGASLGAIARALNEDAVAGVHGEVKWCAATIGRLLANEKYKGALLMQKTFTANYLTKKNVPNTGQLAQYYVEDDHPAIIPPQEWAAAQEEAARRRAFQQTHGLRGLSGGGSSAFYARVFCRRCGGKLQRLHPKGTKRCRWRCGCGAAGIDDERLRACFCEAFNAVAAGREARLPVWRKARETGTPLERLRAGQIEAITAEGPIPFEVAALTRAVLQEAWLQPDGRLLFVFLSGDREEVPV